MTAGDKNSRRVYGKSCMKKVANDYVTITSAVGKFIKYGQMADNMLKYSNCFISKIFWEG